VTLMVGPLVINDSVVSAELDDEVILLNVETGIYFGLDAIGTEIWSALKQGPSEEDIFAQLLEAYEVEPEQLRQDILSFLDKLREQGLVHGA
jgi:PqqD family protein of HPr-rel-A system